MATKESSISFVVPVFNEETGIETTLDALTTELEALSVSYEIIVVNDGSTDRSRQLIANYGNPCVRLVNHPTNAGYGASLKTGLSYASHEFIGIIDADGTYDIHSLPKLIEEINQGFDMVVAQRANIYERDKLLKRLARRAMTKLVKILVDKELVDLNSGFRVFRKSAVAEFIPFLCSTFSFTTSLTILFVERGYFISYVPTQYAERRGRSKVRHIRDSIRALQMIIQGVSYFNPMKIFFGLGALYTIFICFPAMVLALFSMHTLSLYLMIFGSVSICLFALAVLGDTVRVSAIRSR